MPSMMYSTIGCNAFRITQQKNIGLEKVERESHQHCSVAIATNWSTPMETGRLKFAFFWLSQRNEEL